MRLVFIYGLPATGKLTVAQELAKRTGYKLFHNHLVVDLLLSTFEFGSPSFVDLREEFWLSVFDHACRSHVAGMIFTFNPERTVRRDFVERTVATVSGRAGRVDFVELVCPFEELKRRIDSPARRHYRKLNSLSLFAKLQAEGEFDTSHMPVSGLTIDTSLTAPMDAAVMIEEALKL
jgi:AAA domain